MLGRALNIPKLKILCRVKEGFTCYLQIFGRFRRFWSEPSGALTIMLEYLLKERFFIVR
jgi:hypothetical protein